MHKAVSVLIVAVSVGFASCKTKPQPEALEIRAPSREEIEAETYAVYDAMIDYWLDRGGGDRRPAGTLVIRDSTVLMLPLPCIEKDPGRRLQCVRTDEDFFAKNREREPLKPIFRLKLRYVLLSKDDEARLFKDPLQGWKRFYKKYPKAQGILMLSGVGFNTRRDQAIGYLGNGCGGLCGAGYYVLLRKHKAAWTVEQMRMQWVS